MMAKGIPIGLPHSLPLCGILHNCSTLVNAKNLVPAQCYFYTASPSGLWWQLSASLHLPSPLFLCQIPVTVHTQDYSISKSFSGCIHKDAILRGSPFQLLVDGCFQGRIQLITSVWAQLLYSLDQNHIFSLFIYFLKLF